MKRPLFPSLISGVLLWACWPTSPLTFLVFIAWVPLLWLESRSTRLLRFWGLTYLTLLIWNVGTTWWVGNTTAPASGVAANVLNALIMTIPWIGFWKTRRRFGNVAGYLSLVAYQLTFEYIHLNWELSWPWLDIGNVFAGHPGWVQWYEWTGASGGTLWVWAVNILVFQASRGALGSLARGWRMVALALFIPLVISIGIRWYRSSLTTIPESGPDIVIVQPNIDPYNEKFAEGTEALQLSKLIQLSESAIDTSTSLVVWPETAIPFDVNEAYFWQTPALQPLRNFLQRHPDIRLLTGLSGYRELPPDTITPAMRYDKATGKYWEEYNTALQLDAKGGIEFYHKGKLVPGAEIMPYTWIFGFLEKYSLDMGGTSGTLGRGLDRTVFRKTPGGYRAGPIICYESIYGAYTTGYIRNGANVLTVITNDGWWGNTQGYRQHAQYARLRAIETRRWIARSANTGISCFISPVGRVYESQPYDTQAVIKMHIPPLEGKTFFVLMGDWISILAVIWTLLSIVTSIIRFLMRKLSN